MPPPRMPPPPAGPRGPAGPAGRDGPEDPGPEGHVPVVAVASGKGGVGKTTVAVNLALALTELGLRTGLADADLYGPDAAHMLGLRRRTGARHVTLFAPQGQANAQLQAAERHGVQLSSAAFLIGENQGLGIAAPLAEMLVYRLIAGTTWDAIDVLIVDLPPGTADIQQVVFRLSPRPVFALLVVTPQLVAHRDAHRLLHELDRGSATVLGGIENMAGQICPSCGERTPLFTPAPPDEAIWTRIPRLASIPFSAAAAADADRGQPVMITEAVPAQVAAYQVAASRVRDALDQRN